MKTADSTHDDGNESNTSIAATFLLFCKRLAQPRHTIIRQVDGAPGLPFHGLWCLQSLSVTITQGRFVGRCFAFGCQGRFCCVRACWNSRDQIMSRFVERASDGRMHGCFSRSLSKRTLIKYQCVCFCKCMFISAPLVPSTYHFSKWRIFGNGSLLSTSGLRF